MFYVLVTELNLRSLDVKQTVAIRYVQIAYSIMLSLFVVTGLRFNSVRLGRGWDELVQSLA